MLTSTQIISDLEPLFQEILDRPDLQLTSRLTAQDVPEWDSLNHIRLIAGTEQKFKVRMTAAELEKLSSVGDLAGLVATKLAA